MEHPCHGCNTAVEDGVAFCPNCNAPQIRVPAAEEEEPEIASPALGAVGEAQTPAQPVALSVPGPDSTRAAAPATVAAARIEWPQAIPGAALAGVLLAFCLLVPFAAFLVWMLAAGTLAVALYLRRVPHATLSPGMGARLGAISGLFGFGVFALLSSLEMLLSRDSGKVREILQEVLQQSIARNSDPNAQALLQRMMSPEGLAFLFTLGLVLFLAAFLLFSSLGGALGAYLFRRRGSR